MCPVAAWPSGMPRSASLKKKQKGKIRAHVPRCVKAAVAMPSYLRCLFGHQAHRVPPNLAGSAAPTA